MDVCLLYAPVIALVVSVCKRIPFIGKNPKVAAALLAAGAAGYKVIHPDAGAIDVAALLQCFSIQFAGAVASYEVGIKPVVNKIASGLRI